MELEKLESKNRHMHALHAQMRIHVREEVFFVTGVFHQKIIKT